MEELFQGATRSEYNRYLTRVRGKKPFLGELADRLLDDDESDDAELFDSTLTNREFVEVIALCRRSSYSRYSGGGSTTSGIATDSLYSNYPWRFVEEFLQNADDCEYVDTPEIDIAIDESDPLKPVITFTYNEVGFTRQDVSAITAFSESNKVGKTVDHQEAEGVFYREKTGRKGKGFKSVFALQAVKNVIVHIQSNNFSFRLDKEIGRILPIWEENPYGNDGKTHVTVELIEPSFDAESSSFDIEGVYPEFRKMFSASEPEHLFAKNSLLFMHRLRTVQVTRNAPDGSSSGFLVAYEENRGKTIYQKPFVPNPEKDILSGIAKDGVFYVEQMQFALLSVMSDDGDEEIPGVPIIRYTRMVEGEDAYRNYSVIAPLLTSDIEQAWSEGALFRTFPLDKHPINMPLAIDAPFVLNTDRSGILYYSYEAEEEPEAAQAYERNAAISRELFDRGGVLEAFLLWARSIDGIRMDKYLTSKTQTLFDAVDNKNLPKVNINSDCINKVPVFALYADAEQYVSYDEAMLIAKDLFAWPESHRLLSLLLQSDYEKRVLSDRYVGSPLFSPTSIVRENFVGALNGYLDLLDERLGTQEMIEFFNSHLYPFLKNNRTSIERNDGEAFRELRIYYSQVQTGEGVATVREAYSPSIKWLHSESEEPPLSINRYRVFESSPANIRLITGIVDSSLHVGSLESHFHGVSGTRERSGCSTWEEVRDYIEAAYHFGMDLSEMHFLALEGYALSEEFDASYNSFREAGVVQIIPNEEVLAICNCFGNDAAATVEGLKRMGLKAGDDYFEVVGNYLNLRRDTVKLINSDGCTQAALNDIARVKDQMIKDVDATYDLFAGCKDSVLLFFLKKDRHFFSSDSCVSICEAVQNDSRYWRRNDINAKEVLIRALSGAVRNADSCNQKSLVITAGEMLDRKLVECVHCVIDNNRIGHLIIANEGQFPQIPSNEIEALTNMFGGGGETTATRFYAANKIARRANRPFLKDSGHRTINVYLEVDEDGGYEASLLKFLNRPHDRTKLEQYKEMERQYHDVAERVIIPVLNRTNHDLNRAYRAIADRDFASYDKRETIGILSWFRNNGYTNALGNGSINNQDEIVNDYQNDPWKFVYEFIQNVDDCTFEVGNPSLQIALDQKNSKLTFEYNEAGFTLSDIKALTKFGDSNKGSLRKRRGKENGLVDRGQTGRKGRGFKSVFALPGDDIVVHICSNGYTFKFVKRLGYIIPIWEDVNVAPAVGTRIVVEGFEASYFNNLVAKINDMLGVNDTSRFFQTCPTLFLKQLRSLEVLNGAHTYSVDIQAYGNSIYGGVFQAGKRKVTSGIYKNGVLCRSLEEGLKIDLRIDGTAKEFMALRCSKLVVSSYDNSIQTISVMAPLIRQGESGQFTTGSFYCTLPLSEHRLVTPLAINAPFETNSARSALDDTLDLSGVARVAFGRSGQTRCKSRNDELVKQAAASLLPGLFVALGGCEGVCLEEYLPVKNQMLFDNYATVDTVDLRKVIKDIRMLKPLIESQPISFNEAVALPAECYAWPRPDLLCNAFGRDASKLVGLQYAASPRSSKLIRERIDLTKDSFVEGINAYVHTLDYDGDALLSLLKEHIYPFIDQHYEEIRKQYRIHAREGELKDLCIFAFEMADGSLVLEPASKDTIWYDNEDDEYRSFGRHRCLAGSSIEDLYTEYSWIGEMHELRTRDSAFTNMALGVEVAREWGRVREIIETALYYDLKNLPRISYLDNVVLSEEIDPTDNIFRTAYRATQNITILQRVISSHELSDMVKEAFAWDAPMEEVADKLKAMGLRQSDDFFDESPGRFPCINKKTKALLKGYCHDLQTAVEVFDAIELKYKSRKDKGNSAFNLFENYSEFASCGAIVFAQLLKRKLLNGPILQEFAGDYLDMAQPADTLDYKEAYLRSLELADKQPSVHNITLYLSDIVKRELGDCLRRCKLKYSEELSITIVQDIEVGVYSSHDIQTALSWLDKDRAGRKMYEYYTVDIDAAFSGEKPAESFIFDDDRVYLNANNAQNCMYEFVRTRYRSGDGVFGALISIIQRQNELKCKWSGNKYQYITALRHFRRDTIKYTEFLVPGYDEHLNTATGNMLDYVLPELLQNINDCAAAQGQDVRTLKVNVNVTKGFMLLEYDEAGFDFANVYSITAFGQSSKHDASEGEKGLGFKKALAAFDSVEIYSNGFYFSLTAKESTVPEWISDSKKQRRYAVPGKTTMIFRATESQREDLGKLKKQWEALAEGKWAGTKISPLFLRNIDYITVEGCESKYSRRMMENGYVFKRARLIDLYTNLNSSCADFASSYLSLHLASLRKRKKCQTMSEGEVKAYLDSLAVEVCLPRRVDKENRDSGFFYSTLPTEEPTYSSICINLPLELTTGRNGIVGHSAYNSAVMHMAFLPGPCGRSVFCHLLESIALENKDVNVLANMTPGVESFARGIQKAAQIPEDTIVSDLKSTRLLRAFEQDEVMVSLESAFSVEDVVARYAQTVRTPINELDRWMHQHAESASGLTLVVPTNIETREKLERFAALAHIDNRFPIREPGHDFALEYLAAEYGAIKGDEQND